MAKVSIIIPTYNVEQYLVECMESVVRQTLKDIEIICINDGSTDHSLEILKSYAEKDDRIILVDKENGGYGIGMNIGLEKATGEYIGIVEPDDYVPLHMYEDLYQVAKENDLDFVKADFYRFKRNDANGNMELVYFHLSDDANDYNKVFDPSQTPRAVNFVMNTWSGIYRREFLEKNHIRHNETPGASFQDNGFFFQTFAFGKRAMIINKPYYMNRRNEYKREYIQRISAEFNRAMQLGELKKSEFPPNKWADLQFLMKDPDGYYYSIIRTGGAGSSKELEDIKNSTSYRLGFMLTSIPRKIKNKLVKLKKAVK